MYLSKNTGRKDCFLQYVPVSEIAFEPWVNESTLLEDVRDGRNFKDKDIFQQCTSTMSIILYQDSFEVVNSKFSHIIILLKIQNIQRQFNSLIFI